MVVAVPLQDLNHESNTSPRDSKLECPYIICRLFFRYDM